MSNIGEGIGTVLGVALRGAGTVIVGGAGVVSKVIGCGASYTSKELGDGFSQIGDSCFDKAKSIWTGEEAAPRKISLDANKVKVEALMRKIKNFQAFIDNKEKQREMLEEHGIDPALADDPEFERYLERKARGIIANDKKKYDIKSDIDI